MREVTPLPRPAATVVARRAAGQFLVIPVARRASELGSIYVLGGIGERIWELLGRVGSLDELCARLGEEYDVEQDVLRRDVGRFLDDGLSEGILEEGV